MRVTVRNSVKFRSDRNGGRVSMVSCSRGSEAGDSEKGAAPVASRKSLKFSWSR